MGAGAVVPGWAGFNSQPPEGGWVSSTSIVLFWPPFQLTAARRRLAIYYQKNAKEHQFQLTAARRRLVI